MGTARWASPGPWQCAGGAEQRIWSGGPAPSPAAGRLLAGIVPPPPRLLPLLGCDGMLFLSVENSCSWGSTGRNVSHTHTHTPPPPAPLPLRAALGILPPNPSLIKKLKLPISSRINVDFRPRQSPDTSHNLRWLQAAGGACWRTRMTSHRLPRTGVTRRARSREGSAQPIHCHHAVPWTHQDGCWSKGWSRAPS